MIKGEKFAIVLKSHIIEDGFATFRLTKKEVFYEIEKKWFWVCWPYLVQWSWLPVVQEQKNQLIFNC